MCTDEEKDTYASTIKSLITSARSLLATLQACEASGCQGHGTSYEDDMQDAVNVLAECETKFTNLGFDATTV